MMKQDAWKTDEAMEMALLKSCLLFSGKNIKESGATIMEKKIMSLIFQDAIKDVGDIEKYCSINETENDDDAISRLCETIVNQLKKKKIITVGSKGKILLNEETKAKADEIGIHYQNGKSKIISTVLEDVRKEYKKHLAEEAQVKSNIRNCLEYYLYVSSFSFLGYDNQTNIDRGRLNEIAGHKLGRDSKELTDHIIYAIGKLIENPTTEQRKILNAYAKAIMTSQIIGRDPLLRNFKRTKIRQKSFVIDTDIVLYCLTKNTKRGKGYLNMINCLIESGCKLYIPSEVIEEAHDHAEAATKRYRFQSLVIEEGDVALVKCNGHNVFVEDNMYGKNKGTESSWNKYIQNFYAQEYGQQLMLENVKHIFRDKVVYGTYPEIESPVPPDNDEYKLLYDNVLEATQKSPNAKFRDEEKNKKIASVDVTLYLSVKKANLKQMEREGAQQSSGFLCHDYYILTNTVRTHRCAKEQGLEYEVNCSPQAMIVYLRETGLLTDCDIDVSDLFENPFFAYISENYWEDMNNFIAAGIDIRGKSVVRLRLDLKQNMHVLLTADSPSEEYIQNYKEVKEKGYSFTDNVKKIAEEAIQKEEENKALKSEIEKLKRENEQMGKAWAKQKYKKRVFGKIVKGKSKGSSK